MGYKVIIALAFAFIAYQIYTPLPKGWKDDTDIRKISYVINVMLKICDNAATNAIQRILGYDSFALLRWLSSLRKIYPFEGVIITNETWNGIRVLIFTPSNKKPNGKVPGIVYLHGGGWTISSPEGYIKLIGPMVKSTNAVVIAPAYRKAPKFPFPAAYDDSIMVTRHFIKNIDRFGVDSERIAIAGDSAGGNLAAAIGLEMTDSIHSQYLIYPALQFTHFHMPNQQAHKYDPILSERLMNRFRMSYLGFEGNNRMQSILDDHGHLYKDGKFDDKFYEHVNPDSIPPSFIKEPVVQAPISRSLQASTKLSDIERSNLRKLLLDPRLAPLAANDQLLKKSPKTHLITCDSDVLRDEGILYAERLKKLGVKVEHVNLLEAPHGALSFGDIEAFKKFILNFLDVLNKNLNET